VFTVASDSRLKSFSLCDKRFSDEEVETEVRKMLINSQKTCILRVSRHWESAGTNVLILAEDMSRNKYPTTNSGLLNTHDDNVK
jgi:hypothetical protein